MADQVSEAGQVGTAPQPPPRPTGQTPVWDLVIADMRARDAAGRAHYGTPLQVDNGRDHLVDAYHEALDQCVYLRAEIERRNTPPFPAAAQSGLLLTTSRLLLTTRPLTVRLDSHGAGVWVFGYGVLIKPPGAHVFYSQRARRRIVWGWSVLWGRK